MLTLSLCTKSTMLVSTELQGKQSLSSEGVINKCTIDQSISHSFPRLKFIQQMAYKLTN